MIMLKNKIARFAYILSLFFCVVLTTSTQSSTAISQNSAPGDIEAVTRQITRLVHAIEQASDPMSPALQGRFLDVMQAINHTITHNSIDDLARMRLMQALLPIREGIFLIASHTSFSLEKQISSTLVELLDHSTPAQQQDRLLFEIAARHLAAAGEEEALRRLVDLAPVQRLP